MRRALAGALLAGCVAPAIAHQASNSYLQLAVSGDRIDGRWDVALVDLHALVGLDGDGDGQLTWGEVRQRTPQIGETALRGLALAADGADCPLAVTAPLQLERRGDGVYAVLTLAAQCPAAIDTLRLRYELLFAQDALHRGLLRLEHGATHSAAFAPDAREQSFGRERGVAATLTRYLHEGAWHVWTGLDHVLFLATLLLPAVARRQQRRWIVAPDARRAFIDTAWIVTAFTLAHAATLSLVLLGRLSVDPRWVEPLVAATVAAAALNNLRPLVVRHLWLLAFGFGLIHGAAIASVLAELELGAGSLALALAGFNLGVEAGQLAIVAVAVPITYALRHSPVYRNVAVLGGSAVVLVVALVWLAERLQLLL